MVSKEFANNAFEKIRVMTSKAEIEAYLTQIGVSYWFPDEVTYPYHQTTDIVPSTRYGHDSLI